MEDTGIGGLLFIIVLILSMISSVKKQKRSASKTQQDIEDIEIDSTTYSSESEQIPRTEEHTFEEIFQDFFPDVNTKKNNDEDVFTNVNKGKVNLDVEQEKASYQSSNNDYKVFNNSEHENIISILKNNFDSHSNGANKAKTIKNNELNNQHIEKKSIDKSGDAHINIKDDFDLRKAIIYSEILSPKYKEY